MSNIQENLKFLNGYLFLGKNQCILIPMNSFLMILNHLEESYPLEEVIKAFRKSSLHDVSILFEEINSLKVGENIKVNLFLNWINSLGLGKVSLKSNSSFQMSFSLDSIFVSNFYTKLFKSSFPVEEILVSYLLNFCQLLKQKSANHKIKRLGSNFLVQINLTSPEYDFQISKLKYNLNYKASERSRVLRMIISRKQMTLVRGQLRLWNTYGVLVPCFFILELIKQLYSKNLKIFFENLGSMQGKAAVDLQVNIYGAKKEDFLSLVAGQTELVGFGVTHFDMDNLRFKINTNFRKDFSKYFNEKTIKTYSDYIYSSINCAYEIMHDVKTTKKEEDDYWKLNRLQTSRKLDKKEKKIDKHVGTKALITRIFLQQK